MVKPPSFDSNGMKKGAWSKEEDQRLRAYVHQFGHSNWRLLPFAAGLARCGKSCRLRWMNYLKPGLKRGKFTQHEEDLVIQLHGQLGNKWSAISAKLPGRTDNEIKNYWHAHIKKRGRRASSSSSYSSSPISSYTADSQEEKRKIIDVLNPIADLYSFARAEDDLPSDDDSTHQTCFNVDFLPFPEDDQFHDFELFQEMQNASSLFSNSSDGGSSFCSPSTASQFQGNLSSESIGEDMFDMILW